MPKHPKNREKDPKAYDEYQKWVKERNIGKQEEKEEVDKYYENKTKENEEAATELNRRKDTVMTALSNMANSTPFSGNDLVEASEMQKQQRIEEANPYKLMAKTLWELGKIGAASGSLYSAAKDMNIASDGFQTLGIVQDGLEFLYEPNYKDASQAVTGIQSLYNRRPHETKDIAGRLSSDYLKKLYLFKFRRGLGMAGDVWTLMDSSNTLLPLYIK